MKVLYITPLVRGLEDMLRGEMNAMGLPSQILPLKELILDGNKVDIVLISNYQEEINIKSDWLKNENILANINNNLVVNSKLQRITGVLKSIYQVFQTIRHAIKMNEYDFVYCHGTAALIGNIVANMYSVPCGYRLYGLYDVYDILARKGVWAVLLRYKYYMIFKMKKLFMLITDDGSYGDIVYEKWGRKKNPYDFHFWLNGVDIVDIQDINDKGELPEYKYLLMSGRISESKDQLAAVNILSEVRKIDKTVHLCIVGHVESKIYYEKVCDRIKELGLEEWVHFMGPLDPYYMRKLAYYAKANILWQNLSQRGNVFFEIFSVGAVIVAKNDGSLDSFVNDEVNCYLAKNETEAAKKILKCIDLREEDLQKIRENAIDRSKKQMSKWEPRVRKEIDMIYKYIKNKKNNI